MIPHFIPVVCRKLTPNFETFSFFLIAKRVLATADIVILLWVFLWVFRGALILAIVS